MKTIAMCLSGGGYRAAAFHLGVLRALSKLGWLSSVKYLSTASGGTILAARWLVGLARAESFAAFEEKVRAFLAGTNVVQSAVEDLAKSKRPSLIREAADVYDALLEKTTWSKLPLAPFDEVVFNATDFDGGNAFRFVKSSNDKVWIGNKNRKVAEEAVANMRLGDVVAASSCFPGAFEPIVFPRDFAGTKPGCTPDVPLMDGGIYDNQGISSLLLVVKRAQPPDIDLVIVADTDQRARIYEVKETPKVVLGELSLHGVYVIGLVITALAVLAGSAGLVGLMMGETTWARVVGACAAAGCGAIASVFAWLRLAVWPKIVNMVPYKNKNADIWGALQSLSVNQVIALLAERADSVLALTLRAFMGRIRALTYEKVFAESRLAGRVCPVQIYALLDHEDAKVKALATRAHDTATSLWIDQAKLDDVVTCGELTAYAALRERGVDVTQHWDALVTNLPPSPTPTPT
jgi:predicted acylesterase/phospholipase RssA